MAANSLFRSVLNHKIKLGMKIMLVLLATLLLFSSVVIFVVLDLQTAALNKAQTTSATIVSRLAENRIQDTKEALQTKIEQLANVIAKVAPDLILSYDTVSLTQYAKVLAGDKDIAYVSFKDKQGKTLATSSDEKEKGVDIYQRVIQYEGEKVGELIVAYKQDRVAIAIKDTQEANASNLAKMEAAKDASLTVAKERILTVMLISIAISGIMVFLLARSMSKKICAISRIMRDFAGGETDITTRCDVKSNDEIGELAISFNWMAESIQDASERDKAHLDEMRKAADIQGKVDELLDITTKAANGDLTGKVMVDGERAIDKLAEGIQQMLNNLNTLVSQVQRSGVQVTSSATQIAATAKEQQATVTEQAASTNEIMATATEISATTKQLATTVDEVATVAEETTIAATNGQEAVTRMESTMQHMSEATKSISSKLSVLSEKASNINNVVTTITKVADQTNLLSLNAAIEAEKAGEYGLGFAVVATEIRRLADQTAVATWDIEQMVKEMQSAVSAGVMGMDKFTEEVSRGVNEVQKVGSQLVNIIDQVQTLTPRFESVNEGMQSQSLGAEQISEGMVQLNETAQQTATSLRQSNQSIEQLNDAAHNLQHAVSQFKIA
jgi:methyl-accepting chemotaxis protein WspA